MIHCVLLACHYSIHVLKNPYYSKETCYLYIALKQKALFCISSRICLSVSFTTLSSRWCSFFSTVHLNLRACHASLLGKLNSALSLFQLLPHL